MFPHGSPLEIFNIHSTMEHKPWNLLAAEEAFIFLAINSKHFKF